MIHSRWALLAVVLAVAALMNPVQSHHVTTVDGRLVQPYALTVAAHIPVAAGYEPVPTPQHCLEGADVTGAFYTQDFEGTHGFTFTGTSLASGTTNLWHVTSYAGGGDDTGHTQPKRLYYGRDAQGDYDVGHSAGVAQSPVITLPSSGDVYLGFATKWQTEWLKGYDHLWVELQDTSPGGRIHLLCTANAYDRADPSGGAGETIIPSCSPYHFTPCPAEVGWAWEQRFIPLPDSLLGKDVRIRFTFDSADDKANPYMGWMVDDVVLGSGVAADV